MKQPDRRSILLGGTGAAAFLAGREAAAQTLGAGSYSPSYSPPSSLANLAALRSYRSHRSSSYDRSGGNADSVRLEPGATVPLLETQGPGMVMHIWIPINSAEDFHLKKLVLRAYWDGESEPSVEAPVGDFFGLTMGDSFLYESALTTVSSIKARNAHFPMPFEKSVRITLANEGEKPAAGVYYSIDFIAFSTMPGHLGYFHAQYRRAAPCQGWTDNWQNDYQPPVDDKKNPTGEGNYLFLEAQGRGHFVGVTHGVLQNQEGWWGEGDDMIFVDGEDRPGIDGTGAEDYYNGLGTSEASTARRLRRGPAGADG